MDYSSVKLITHHPEADPETGEPIPVLVPHFEVLHNDGSKTAIPLDPSNRHYWEVKEWYNAQKTKPFDFDFEELPEPNFEETIYPEPEETEEPADSEELPQDEPKTLLPK